MNIKSVKKIKSIMDGSFAGYEVTTVDNTVWSVPLDTDNIKYAEVIKWEKIDGNTIAEAD
tara:strand:+ start:1151 stop:1330 length:180 start_codon:yes stop_codon:yes gene_type:complete